MFSLSYIDDKGILKILVNNLYSVNIIGIKSYELHRLNPTIQFSETTIIPNTNIRLDWVIK